eukprot:1358985-Amphidinium_carterae.2
MGRDFLPDRCVQGVIPNVRNVVVGSFDADGCLNPGMMDTLTRTAGGLKSEQWGGKAQKVALGSDVGADVADYDNTAAQNKITVCQSQHLPYQAQNGFPRLQMSHMTLGHISQKIFYLCGLKKELDGLVKQGVWQWDDCADFSDVKKKHAEHHHARLFPLAGIKHWEDEALMTFKGRIVLGGHAIDSASQHIDFQEVGITPAAMESARTSMLAAFADRDGGENGVIQFDAP